jgi:hypothetical protein
MSYRKIDVDGVTYQYSVGRTHTKVKGFDAVPNTEIGIVTRQYLKPCGFAGCNCDPYQYTYALRVTPKSIAEYIKQRLAGVTYPKSNQKPILDSRIGKIFLVEYDVETVCTR